MDFLSDTVALSRAQFALTAIFHLLWPVLTTGISIYLVFVEGLWLKTRNYDFNLSWVDSPPLGALRP